MPNRPTLISPSVLSADMAALGSEVKRLESGGADWIHIDVMDGHFVPNITIGIPVISALSKVTNLPLDVHLMIMEPERYIDDFAEAGATILSVQVESTLHLYRTLVAIREKGMKAAAVLNPASPVSMLENVLAQLDMVLIMTVEPGFSGQKFIPSMVSKIEEIYKMIENSNLDVDIQVDGGINKDTIGLVAQAGANVFVAGTSVFTAADVKSGIEDLRLAV